MSDLEGNSFLAPFSEKSRRRLLDSVKIQEWKDGESIFAEGDASNDVYLVKEGAVELVKKSGPDHMEILGVASEGSYFGELGVLEGTTRSTSARAKGQCILALIPRPLLMEILQGEPVSVTLQLLKRVVDYLRSTNELFVAEVVRKEKLHLIGEMARSIIHDLKNPITGIQMAAELMQSRFPDEPQVAKWSQQIRDQTKRMTSMVQDLLDFSRGESCLVPEKVFLPDLANVIHEAFREKMEKAGIEWCCAMPEREIVADRHRIYRVFQNLVGNAVDILEKKGGKIEFTFGEKEGGVLFGVKDNGAGIPEKIRDRVFEAFVTFGKPNGTGLGMSIVKNLVEAHRGKIWFETETGKGTHFFVFLPQES